ncbi:hypothetical protein [Bordetella genomosp. 11]|nr:hypothetical protein [Bordetella genomosp. 11]
MKVDELDEGLRRALERSQGKFAMQQLVIADIGDAMAQPFAHTAEQKLRLKSRSLAAKTRALVVHDQALTLYPRSTK